MDTQKIRYFRKLLRIFKRMTVNQLKADSCCQGVTLAQCHAILEIEELGQATIAELSKRLRLDKSTLSRTVDGLVNLGIIERISHPSDRRFNLLSLTKQGQKTADRINQSNDDYFCRVFQGIEVESHDTVINNFEKLVSAMGKHFDSLEEEKRCSPKIIQGE